MEVIKDEKILVELAQNGDEAAFTQIVREYSDRLYTLLIRLLRNHQEAEDALQETFITMVNKIQDYQGRSSLYTWLYRIATNTALMRLRKRKTWDISIDESTMHEEVHNNTILPFPDRPDQNLDKKEMKTIIDESVQKLPPDYRSVFILRDIENVPIKEASEILGISTENVKTRLRRARIALRNEIAGRFV